MWQSGLKSVMLSLSIFLVERNQRINTEYPEKTNDFQQSVDWIFSYIASIKIEEI